MTEGAELKIYFFFLKGFLCPLGDKKDHDLLY